MVRFSTIVGTVVLLWGTSAMAAAPEASQYWLGVECLPVPSALRTQLNLPKEEGLLVEAVSPDSPAAKAGIQPYDVLVHAGDNSLAQPQDLVQAIQAAKGGKLSIEVVRNGKRQTLEATPVARPKDARRATEQPQPGDWETMEKWIERMYPGGAIDGRHPPLHFRIFQPGAIVPRGALLSPPLPDNMSIVISKQGKQPAKIVVNRGDEKWEVTENELDKLPADVRSNVDQMLGHNLFGTLMPEATAVGPNEQFDSGQAEASSPQASALSERIQKQFDALNHRMDRLMKEVEEMHKGAGKRSRPKNRPPMDAGELAATMNHERPATAVPAAVP